jgi:hypothetical protein
MPVKLLIVLIIRWNYELVIYSYRILEKSYKWDLRFERGKWNLTEAHEIYFMYFRIQIERN